MEDKLPNDKLEEFLRRSLEGHSEDPPGDLWSKIAGGLEPPVAMPTGGAAVRPLRPVRRWWMAAAAAVVAGLLIGQHLYFNGKIARLGKELEQNALQLKQLEQQKLTQQKGVFEPENATKNATATTSETQNDVAAEGNENEAVKGSAPASKEANRPSGNADAHFPKGKKQLKNEVKTAQQQPSTEQTATAAGANGVAAGGQKNEAPTEKMKQGEVAQQLENQAVTVAKQSDLQKVWLKRIVAIEVAEAPGPLANAVAPIIPVHKPAARFSIGLNAMPMVTRTEINEVREPGPGGGGGHGHGDRKSFKVDSSETAGQAWMAGLSLETALTPKLRIGTGIAYRRVDNTTKHIACFDFKDRRGHGHGNPGSNDHEHEFEYDLNTPTGNVEMALRADTDEAAQDIPDEAVVKAEISTSERLDFATVPLYANYALGNGRLRVLAKAGVLFNFLLGSDFEVGPIKSLNQRFEFRRGRMQTGSPADLQTVSVGYMAGLGLEYRLNRSFSLRLEPTVSGSLTSLHNNRFIESSEFSAGVNMGAMYSF